MELFFGFYFGVILMIILHNFHWYSVTKEKSYLYYAIFKVLMILVILQSAHIIFINQFLLIFTLVAMFFIMLLFTQEFLALKNGHIIINRIVYAVMVLILVGFVYSAFTGNYAIFALPYSLVLSPFIFLGVYIYRQGFKPAGYYVIAWGLSLILVGLKDLNVFTSAEFYPNVPFDLIGGIIESIILSYAITVKTNLMAKEKEQQSKILIHQSKLASMGQMLENISHQWRQPLNRISSFIINMQVHINDKYKNDTCLSDGLSQSQLQLEYMSSTLDDFTDFNKQAKHKEAFLVSSVINSVINIVGNTLENYSISLEVENIADFSMVSYPTELSHVVLNLVQNAKEALAERKIKQPKIKIVINKNKISIEDNAGGVDAAIVDRIFEPYFTTKSKSTSLGVGLYMSKVILDKHFHAEIGLDSMQERTSFYILFIGDGLDR